MNSTCLTIDAIMAEGDAEEVVLDNRNGSFQNQSEEGRGNRTTSFFLLFSACWYSVIPVVRFPRGDSFFFLSSANYLWFCPRRYSFHANAPGASLAS